MRRASQSSEAGSASWVRKATWSPDERSMRRLRVPPCENPPAGTSTISAPRASAAAREPSVAAGPGQSKLVRCARGAIVDVLVDLRRGSPTFGRWEAFELDDREMRLLYCPVGFGHGFCVTSEIADVVYKLSSYYDADLERGIA